MTIVVCNSQVIWQSNSKIAKFALVVDILYSTSLLFLIIICYEKKSHYSLPIIFSVYIMNFFVLS